MSQKHRIKEYASEIGFDVVAVTNAEPLHDALRAAEERKAQGFLECFPWFTSDRLARGCSPKSLLSSASSVICVAAAYSPAAEELDFQDDGKRGRISRYALVSDYHEVMRARLSLLVDFLEREAGIRLENRMYVDTGPVPERAIGQRAGVGWFGKNTNLLVPGIGSWVFLGELVTSLDIDSDAPLRKSCGACETCLKACPAGALVAPYTLDARRCISYLTIELKGWIPRELRPTIGRWVFGCDLCQDVCPTNSRARSTESRVFERSAVVDPHPPLEWLLAMDEGEYRAKFRKTALHRAKRRGIRRNAAVALGNSGDRSAVTVLLDVLEDDADELLRGHAAWALGRLGGNEAKMALEKARARETSRDAAAEIEFALLGL